MRQLRANDLDRVAGGYTSLERYAVRWTDSRNRITFDLVRIPLRKPFRKIYPRPASVLRRYRAIVRMGWSVGAYDGARLVGLALAEPRFREKSVFVWELGVAASHRRRGIGTRLLAAVERRARSEGFRAVICETQTTNVPAIDFYRRAGFRTEGVDVSEYSNQDLRTGEIALFMKKRVAPSKGTTQRHRVRRQHAIG